MTYLQKYEEQITQDVKALKTYVFTVERSRGTQALKDAEIAKAWDRLDEKVARARAEYTDIRESRIAEAKKLAAINFHNITNGDHTRVKAAGSNFSLDILSAPDAAAQNVVLAKLADFIKLLTDTEKASFGKIIFQINDLLIDKAASKTALQAVIAEVKNVDNPHEATLAEFEALPTVIGADYDTAKAEYEASLVEEASVE